MLYGIIGKKGCGKTLMMTYLLKKYSEADKKIRIYTTYKLKGIKYEEINFMELFKNDTEIKNAVVAIDEAYLFADCRTSSSKMNRIISYLLYQTRKTGVDMFFTAISFSTIEKRLRHNRDGLFFPNLYVDGKKILNPENITQEKMNMLLADNHIIQIKGLLVTDYGTKSFCIDHPEKIFSHYSSYEVIKPKI